MNITVTIDEVTLATAVEQTYRQISEDDWRPDGHVTVGEMVARLIVDRLLSDHADLSSLRDRVKAIRDEEIRKRVAPMVEEAIATPVQKTNHFGEPTGEATTLRELVIKEARDALTRGRDPYRNGTKSLLDQTIEKTVQEAFLGVIADEVKKVRDAVTRDLGAQAAAAITATVQNALAGRR